MPTDKKAVEDYIESLGGDWRSEAISRLREIVLKAAPGAKESIKWVYNSSKSTKDRDEQYYRQIAFGWSLTVSPVVSIIISLVVLSIRVFPVSG